MTVKVQAPGQEITIHFREAEGQLPDLKAVMIGPEEARLLLEKNIGNRPFRKKTAEKYAKDMREGRWFSLKQPGLIFDEHGNLAEGQHRLEGVILAGVTLPFYIQYGVPRHAITQSELKRSFRDHQAMCGRASNEFLIAVMRCMHANGTRKTRDYTFSEEAELLEPFEEAATWALGLFKERVKGIVIAGTVAAIASAYYHCMENPAKMRRIKEFARQLVEKTPRSDFDNQDQALKPLLRWLETYRVDTSTMRVECFLYTQGVIDCFLRKQSRLKLFRPEPGSLF